MRRRFRIHRVLLEKAILACVLPAVAGAVNASGFFAIGTYTSHVTGNVARIGDELAVGHLWLALRAIFLVGSFLSGSMLATALVLRARRAGGPPYWRALLIEASLLFVFATVSVGGERSAHINSLQMTCLLCLAMGLQNALVTKLSGARVRTTHMTGITTDLGIETARAIDAWVQRNRAIAGPGLAPLPSLRHDPALRKWRLHVAVLGSFLVGATLGPLLYLWVGHIAMLVPCVILVALAAFDGWIGLSETSFVESSINPLGPIIGQLPD